jgi:hypothetical protein
MSIESLVNQIQESRKAYDLFNPPAASAEAISEVASQFEREFAHTLPTPYQQLLRASDGVLENGLTIWPCHPYWKFNESVITANRDLRENISDRFFYFGLRDDSVFVLEIRTGRFLAIELNGLAEWEVFSDCEAMIEFMLARALD